MESRPSSQRKAKVFDDDVTRVSSVAIRPLATIGIKTRAAVIRAIRNGDDVGKAIRTALKEGRTPLTQAMTASFVMGLYRSNLNHGAIAELSLARKVTDPLGRWERIVDFATKRVQLTQPDLAEITRGFDASAAEAFKSMGGFLESSIRLAIKKSVEQSESREGTIQAVRTAFDEAGMTNAKPYIIEAQARTQSQLAYSAGRLKANEDEAIQDELWGYEYVTVGDDRVRPGHAALDGVRLPKDDPKWKEIMPPNGWNCRCAFIEVFKDEEIAKTLDVPEFVKVDGTKVRAGADDGFDFNPLDIYNSQDAGIAA